MVCQIAQDFKCKLYNNKFVYIPFDEINEIACIYDVSGGTYQSVVRTEYGEYESSEKFTTLVRRFNKIVERK